jgi:hypothetical protein
MRYLPEETLWSSVAVKTSRPFYAACSVSLILDLISPVTIFSTEFGLGSGVSSILLHYLSVAAAEWFDSAWDRVVRNDTNSRTEAKITICLQ